MDADDRRTKPDAIALGSGANIVIGWDNSRHIAELQRLIAESERKLVTPQVAKKQAEAGIAQLNKRINAGDNLLQNFSDYALIDHRACSLRIEELEEERRRIQSADTVLRDLEARIAATKTKRKEAAETATRIADALEKLRDTIGRITTRRTEAERLLATLGQAGEHYEPARLDHLHHRPNPGRSPRNRAGRRTHQRPLPRLCHRRPQCRSGDPSRRLMGSPRIQR